MFIRRTILSTGKRHEIQQHKVWTFELLFELRERRGELGGLESLERGLRLVALDVLLHLPLALGRVIRLLDSGEPAEEEARGEHKRLVGEAARGIDAVEGGALSHELADLEEDPADEAEEPAEEQRSAEEGGACDEPADHERGGPEIGLGRRGAALQFGRVGPVDEDRVRE